MQLHAEYTAIVPDAAKTVKLRVEWHKLSEKVLESARKVAQNRSDLAELLSSMNEFDEGLYS